MKYALLILLFAQASFAAKPNIVIIYTDDQGYGDVSCLNPDAKFQTPNMDRLAREGIRFTDGHSSDTVCTPSRYGLLTGRYSWRTELKRGVFGAERACLIVEGRMTLATMLRDQGYQTAMVGKWHLGMDFPGERDSRDWTQPVQDMPLDKGFDYFWGIPASMNYGVLAWFEGRYAKVPPTQYTQKKPNKIALADYRIMPPYDDLKPPKDKPDGNGNIKGTLEIAPDFVDSACLTRFTDQAISWMDTNQGGKPFFLYLPYTSPHKPVIPLPEFRGQGEAGAYGEFMIETDHHIGRILKFLDDAKLADDTLIVLTSDNGPETTWKERVKLYKHDSSGEFTEGKRSIYEGGHRVPFIVRWPAGIQQPGRACDRPVCQTDLLATFAELLNVKLPNDAGEDSDSFYASLLDPEASRDRVPMIHHASNGRFAIRDGQWKLIMEEKKSARQLYDLSSDPGEQKDLIKSQPERARDLAKKIRAMVENGRSTSGKPVPNDTPSWRDVEWSR
ncbi:MAG: arylsulfatase A [Candidatus Omnitrophota bacterium]|jgi:arylsulfatase A